METSKLFAELVNRPENPSGGIITGTAVTDSVDGSVVVQIDGPVVAQPAEDVESLTVSAEEFADGAFALPSVPYAGTLTITDSNNVELEEEEYELNGNLLTIWALSSSPVEIAYQTNVRQALSNADFDGDDYAVESTDNLQLLEEVSAGDWQPASYTLIDNIITVAGIGHTTGIVEFAYTYSVSQVCGIGDNVLPNAPDSVTVYGRNSSGVDVPFAGYTLSGDVITLPADYDVYTVNYDVDMVEAWNVSEQYEEVPLEDSDDSADPVIVTIGHDLQWVPDTVTSCTIDGVAATYTLDGANVVVDSPTVTERFFTLTYDAPVSLEVPASMFATGAFTLPSIPLGAVTTTMAGAVLANTCADDQLSIPSLVTSSPSYSIAYTAQVEQATLELPCTPYVAAGQFVEIAVVNGMPTVIGASGSGDVTMTIAGDAADAATAAEAAATAAQAVADAVNQHFWQRPNNPDGAGAGVFITEVSQEDFTDPASPNYQSGANQLSNSSGILLRDGLTNFAQLTPGETAFYDGQGNAASNVVATFGTSGSVIGKADESHAFVDYHSMQMVDKDGDTYFHVRDLRDNSGYATITETWEVLSPLGQLHFTVATAPTTTVSVLVDGSPMAYTIEIDGMTYRLSPGAGWGQVVAITYTSDSPELKAYTLGTRAAGAEGPYSFSAGKGNVSPKEYSATIGNGLIASEHSQTVVGKNNEVVMGTPLFVVGNGSTSSSRSNALVVRQSGEVEAGSLKTVDPAGSGTDYVISSNGEFYELTVSGYVVGDLNVGGKVVTYNKLSGANLNGAAYSDTLDDLKDGGVYYCSTSATDGPESATAGLCVVASGNGGNNVVQLFTTYKASSATYARRLYQGAWSSWQLVGDAATEDAPTLTGASATTFVARRKGGAVTIYANALHVTSALASGSAVQIATLPAGYRPAYTTGIPLISTTVNAAHGVWLYVTSGGNVSIYNRSGNSLATTSNLYCAGTYVS